MPIVSQENKEKKSAGSCVSLEGFVWYVAEILCLACIYYVAARLGMLLELGETQASPVWPPSGIAIAFVLMLGYRVWPGILLGAFFASVAFSYLHQVDVAPLSWETYFSFIFNNYEEVFKALSIGVGSTLEALIAGVLMIRGKATWNPFERVRNVVIFFAVILFSCSVSATIGAVTVCVGGVPWSSFQSIWLTRWLGNSTGGLVLVPLVVSWVFFFSKGFVFSFSFEKALAFLALLFVVAMTFMDLLSVNLFMAQAYMLLPILMFFVFRYSLKEASLGLTIVTVFSVLGTINGLGPFAREEQNESLLLLIGFISVIAVAVVSLHATLAERKDAQLELQGLAEDLEKRVELRTAQLAQLNVDLQQSNQELESFAYVASHDLKAPLEGIMDLSDWITEDLGDALVGENKENMRLLQSRVTRLRNLLTSLLEYSRAGRKRKEPETVCVRDLLEEIVDLVNPRQGMEISLEGEFPEFITERGPLQQVFMNLIGNAIKHHDKSEGKIRVFCDDRELEFYRFTVVDDGPGIAKEFHEKVFGMFTTLRPRDDVEGSGMGMAIVKKIIENRNGEIQLISGGGERGSTIAFTWKKNI